MTGEEQEVPPAENMCSLPVESGEVKNRITKSRTFKHHLQEIQGSPSELAL